jgi:hybrid cluster-associated redox disulfide protein
MMLVIFFFSEGFYTLNRKTNYQRRINMGTAEKKRITKDSIIGEVIKEIPGARDVIQKHFGGGCFTCPGINMESISFGSMMHNLDPEKIVQEINNLEG